LYKIVNPKKRFLTMLADFIGNSVSFPFRPFKKYSPIQPESIKRILLIRTAYIGDVIMTLPMLKPLKEHFPEASIEVLTSSGGREILLNNPYVDDILVYEPFWFYARPFSEYLKFFGQLRKLRFDLTIEARADIRDIFFLVFPARSRTKLSYAVGGGGYFLSHVVPYEKLKHKVEYHLDLTRYLGCDTSVIEWGVYLTAEEKAAVDRLLEDNDISSPFICAHPGGRMLLKRWPLDRCASLYDKIIESFGLPLVILSAGSETEVVNEILVLMKNQPVVLAGRTTIRELYGVIARAELLICNDSAPMHMAAAAGTKTVAIFGPSNSFETGPFGDSHLVVEKAFVCRPECDESRCTNIPHHACMETITVGDVFQAVERQMDIGQH
jgi:lipopolysaccharide heptosyltransferase II